MAVTEVLVLRALGMGDLLVSVPALRGLRAAYPHARITLAAPPGLRALAGLTGAIDDLLPTSGLGELAWPGAPPDVAVNLHGSGPRSIADLAATRPARLLTHAHPEFPMLNGPLWRADVHEAQRWCELLGHYGIPANCRDLFLTRPGLGSPAPGAVVLHPGAGYGSRRWPADRFAAVARVFAEREYRVVVTGNAEECALAESVAPADSDVLTGRSLPELAALIADASLVVCGDTGIGHLATAYGTPSVVLFGPVPPWQWGPPSGTPHVTLWSGRAGDPFAEEPDPGLLAIAADEVVAVAGEVIRPRPPWRGSGSRRARSAAAAAARRAR